MNNIGKRRKDLDTFTIPRRKESGEGHGGAHQSVLTDAYGSESTSYSSKSTGSNPLYARRPPAVYNQRIQQEKQEEPPQQPEKKKPPKRTWDEVNVVPAAANPKTYRDSWDDLYDPTLPSDLLMSFLPLCCNLCSADFSSSVVAKTHYKSKNHDKKVRAWLLEYSKETGAPLHPRASQTRPKDGKDIDPKYFYCEVCDLNLTGKVHAESHYMGKAHQKALLGKNKPSGAGFFNEDGKWNRTVAAKKDPTGRDGFGQDFILKDKKANSENLSVAPLQEQPQPQPARKFCCDTCKVYVTSAVELDIHYHGMRHKRKLKSVEDEKERVSNIIPPDADLSTYATSGGQFYCKSCNVYMNSVLQFSQHLQSKKHTKKLKLRPVSPSSSGSSSDF